MNYKRIKAAAQQLRLDVLFHRSRKFGLRSREMVAENMDKVQQLKGYLEVTNSLLEYSIFDGDDELREMAQKLQEQYNDEVEPAHSNLRSAAFVQVSSSARAKRQMMYEQAQDRASAALRLSRQLNDMAYSGLTAKLHVNEAKRVATTKKHFYRMQLPPTLFKKCKMQSLKDMMSEAKNEIAGIAQLALCDSITAPDFLKRVKALVPFDDYCVAATTAIAKIEEVLEQAAETDNIILEHQRAARQKTMKEMGKEKKQTRSPKKSTKKLNPRMVERYKQEKLNPIFVPLMGQLMAERPRDVAEFVR